MLYETSYNLLITLLIWRLKTAHPWKNFIYALRLSIVCILTRANCWALNKF